MSDLNVQPMEQRPQTPRPQNVGLPHTTHGTSTLNCLTPMSSPWNEDPKLSDSNVQPMEQRPQTIRLSRPTHGTKASNHLTLTSNPWNEGLKPSNSHIVDGEERPPVLLILNQLQFKNRSVGLKERPSPVYQVLTMTG